MSLCVIDGDLVSYIASAASEERTIKATYLKSGKTKGFKNRTTFKEFLKGKEDRWKLDDFSIEDILKPEPIEYCLHTVKSMINSIQAATGCKELKMVLSGTGNFRDSLPLPSKYKGNRENMVKPVLLKQAREYISENYVTEVADGCEGDDILTCYQYEGYKKKRNKIVACSIDKDAYGTRGWLYNWNKMTKPELIEDGIGYLELGDKNKVSGRGFKWKVFQWCKGDPVDGFKPTELTSFKYGDMSCYKDFNELQTERECLEKVVELYQKWYPDPFCYPSWDGAIIESDYLHMMQLYMDCVHMFRKKNDRLDVKKLLEQYEVNYDNP